MDKKKHKEGIEKLFFDITSEESVGGNSVQARPRSFTVDVHCDNESYYIDADMPGINIRDIDVSYENQYLSISANYSQPDSSDKRVVLRRERASSIIKRSFYIENIDEKNIKANLSMGVLHIVIPRK